MRYIYIFLLLLPLKTFCQPIKLKDSEKMNWSYGAIDRAGRDNKELTVIFTADKWADGYKTITHTLKKHKIKGAFFFTGDFYRNPEFKNIIKTLKKDGHYLGAHSDKHLLYCDWSNRENTLVSRVEIMKDIADNISSMEAFGIKKKDALYFVPPYQWYNFQTSKWLSDIGFLTINFTAGTSSNADYTTPDMKNYLSSDEIYKRILKYESSKTDGLNGFLLLIHFGTDPKRTDKLYDKLDDLILELKRRGYNFVPLKELIEII